jgi:hypothetical protein
MKFDCFLAPLRKISLPGIIKISLFLREKKWEKADKCTYQCICSDDGCTEEDSKWRHHPSKKLD